MEIETRGLAPVPDPRPSCVGAIAERAAREYGWRITRHSHAGDVSMQIAGDWTDFELTLRWQPRHDSVEVRCAFALAPPRERWVEVSRLADSMNRTIHRGVLELCIEQDHGSYIDWVPMASPHRPSERDLIEAMRSAVGTCDMLLFPAFHCVSWAEINAETALDRLNFGPVNQLFH